MDNVAWDGFKDSLEWNQGEHVTLIGPTGQGKTTLAVELLERRKYVVVFACKPHDPLIEELVSERDYFLTETWPPPSPREKFSRVVFWPRIEKMSDVVTQKLAFKLALEDIYRQGKWAVYLDECRYITDTLKLTSQAHLLWLQGRSLKISFVVGTQRPFWIPLEAMDQATHLFLWRENDERNLDRLKGLGSVRGKELRETVTALGDHEFVYVNTRSGEMVRSKVELKEGVAA